MRRIQPLVLCLCAPLLFLQAPPAPQRAATPVRRPVPAISHVLIVSIDGLRPDLLVRAKAPAIHGLIEGGSFTFWARTITEGYTVPSHVSMLTGVLPSRHGVTWDKWITDAYPQVPTLFELAKKAGITTALVIGKGKLTVLTKPGTLDWQYQADEEREGDAVVADKATAMIRTHKPGVLFVHFAGVDVAGHANGWGSDAQMRAMETTDRAVGALLSALTEMKLTDSTLVILTGDHGGAGLLHPPEDVRSQFIPWIAAGPGVRKHFDLTSVTGLNVRTTDTFATACALLGIAVPQPIDGKPVLAILETPAARGPR